jgi:hypothetical protein
MCNTTCSCRGQAHQQYRGCLIRRPSHLSAIVTSVCDLPRAADHHTMRMQPCVLDVESKKATKHTGCVWSIMIRYLLQHPFSCAASYSSVHAYCSYYSSFRHTRQQSFLLSHPQELQVLTTSVCTTHSMIESGRESRAASSQPNSRHSQCSAVPLHLCN